MPVSKRLQSVIAKVDPALVPVEEKVKEIKAVAANVTDTAPIVEKPPRKKRILTEEQKSVLRERLIKARAARASKREVIV